MQLCLAYVETKNKINKRRNQSANFKQNKAKSKITAENSNQTHKKETNDGKKMQKHKLHNSIKEWDVGKGAKAGRRTVKSKLQEPFNIDFKSVVFQQKKKF